MSDATTVDWNGLGKEAINEILEWAKGAKEFVSEQAPELVREILAWGFWSSAIVAIVCAILVPVLLVLAYKLGKDSLERETPLAFFSCMVLSISCFLCTIALSMNAYQAFYVSIAPRMYLLECLRDLVK